MSRAAAHSSESNLFLCAPGSAVIPVRKKHAEVSRPQACRRRFFPRHSEPAPECFSDGRSPTGHPIANSEIVELAPPAKALSGGDIYRFICVVTALGFFFEQRWASRTPASRTDEYPDNEAVVLASTEEAISYGTRVAREVAAEGK